MATIAIVQRSPVFLDRAGGLAAAVAAVAEARGAGAQLAVFPEAYVPGYPAWIWRLRPGGDMALADQLHHALLENAIDLSREHLEPLQKAAREHRMTVVCGIHERDGSGTASCIGPWPGAARVGLMLPYRDRSGDPATRAATGYPRLSGRIGVTPQTASFAVLSNLGCAGQGRAATPAPANTRVDGRTRNAYSARSVLAVSTVR